MSDHVTERSFMMYCPICHKLEQVTITTNILHSGDKPRYIATDVRLRCEDCKAMMFEIDVPMVSVLTRLNDHNIQTQAHCAHMYKRHGSLVEKPDKLKFSKQLGAYHGPYVMVKNLQDDVSEVLNETIQAYQAGIIDHPSEISLAVSRRGLDCWCEVENLVQLEMTILEKDPKLVQVALEELYNFVSHWVEELDKRDIRHPEDRKRLLDITIPNYQCADPVLEHANPYKEITRM
ncbi:MAG: hypothetical protein NC114_06295 [Ruminococcus flavefaciens]|nr:hypothetical protein [Ruminococcus flavefaciens]